MSMDYKIVFSQRACDSFELLEKNPGLKKQFKAIKKALGYLQINPRHPSLNIHKFSSKNGPDREEIFEAYAENNTPGAYRIFWYYGAHKKQIIVLSISPHP